MTFPKQLRKSRVTEFFTSEVVHYFDVIKQCTEVDREGLIPLLKVGNSMHVSSSFYTMDKFQERSISRSSFEAEVDLSIRIRSSTSFWISTFWILFSPRIPLFDSPIRPNAIFPAEQAKSSSFEFPFIVVAPFRAPVLSTARYHNLTIAQIKSGHVKRYVGVGRVMWL